MMKFHADNQIASIMRLQEEARAAAAKAREALSSADALAAELKAEHGYHFVCSGVPYKLEHRAVGIHPGNRDWLVVDSSIKVIE